MDVIAFGEVLVDLAQKEINESGYPTLVANPGGAPANFLATISKFGLRTSMIAKVGNDAFGKALINTLKENKINTKNIIVDDNFFTTLAFVTFNDKGDRSFSFARKPGADTQISFNEIDLSLIDKTKVFHFGTLSLTNEPAKTSTKKLVKYAKEKGKIISFDPNLRKPLWNNLEDARSAMNYGLKNADIVKISDDEAKFLLNVKTKEATKTILKKYPNIKLLYVTCGAKGTYFATKNCNGFVKALDGLKVIDTTGAGDIFGGSAMYKLLLKRKEINNLSKEDLLDIVEFATTSAGLSTTKLGGISSIASKEEIEKYTKKPLE